MRRWRASRPWPRKPAASRATTQGVAVVDDLAAERRGPSIEPEGLERARCRARRGRRRRPARPVLRLTSVGPGCRARGPARAAGGPLGGPAVEGLGERRSRSAHGAGGAPAAVGAGAAASLGGVGRLGGRLDAARRRGRRRSAAAARRSLMTFSGQEVVALLGEDPAQPGDVVVVELPVARRRALGVEQPLALEEADLRDRDVGELRRWSRASTSPIDRCGRRRRVVDVAHRHRPA